VVEKSELGEATSLECKFNQTPLEDELGKLGEPVNLIKVDETRREPLRDRLAREYRFVGGVNKIGGGVKYLVKSGTRLVGAIGLRPAACEPGPRDKFIGRDEKTMPAKLSGLVDDNRFLILPWIRVRGLAARALNSSPGRLRDDWLKRHGEEPLMVETIARGEPCRRACRVEDNWTPLGSARRLGGNSPALHGAPSFHRGVLGDIGLNDKPTPDPSHRLADRLKPRLAFSPRSENRERFTILEMGFLSDPPPQRVDRADRPRLRR
jgi:hypothetical protein